MQLVLASLAAGQPASVSREARRGPQQQPGAVVPRRRAAAALVASASSLDSKSLLTSDALSGNSLSGSVLSSNSLGPKAPGTGSPLLGTPLGSPSTSKPQITLDEVPLASGVEVDYSSLRDLLKEGKWREAEDATRELLIQAAGAAAVRRGWVYFSEVKTIPVDDLRTLDGLWRVASGGKFGYSVQREVWMQKGRQWPKFFKAIDWVQGENNVYRKWPSEFNYSADAPKGHLPLTNALRGTRLFEAIMEHEAFAKPAPGSSGGSSSGAAQPSWLNK